MLYISSRLMRCLIFSLAGCANFIFVSTDCVFAEDTKSPASVAAKLDHILLEVSDPRASIAFYRDFLGLRLKSQSQDFVTLESGNVGVFLWSGRWDWEKPRTSGERQGLGMYPHFEVSDTATIVDRARQAGYRIVQEPRKYDWGSEAFIADPDGYIWAFVSPPK
jgi:catechol 2,3-dioxygenase-like lactoylglutathione lyase family enzyme